MIEVGHSFGIDNYESTKMT